MTYLMMWRARREMSVDLALTSANIQMTIAV